MENKDEINKNINSYSEDDINSKSNDFNSKQQLLEKNKEAIKILQESETKGNYNNNMHTLTKESNELNKNLIGNNNQNFYTKYKFDSTNKFKPPTPKPIINPIPYNKTKSSVSFNNITKEIHCSRELEEAANFSYSPNIKSFKSIKGRQKTPFSKFKDENLDSNDSCSSNDGNSINIKSEHSKNKSHFNNDSKKKLDFSGNIRDDLNYNDIASGKISKNKSYHNNIINNKINSNYYNEYSNISGFSNNVGNILPKATKKSILKNSINSNESIEISNIKKIEESSNSKTLFSKVFDDIKTNESKKSFKSNLSSNLSASNNKENDSNRINIFNPPANSNDNDIIKNINMDKEMNCLNNNIVETEKTNNTFKGISNLINSEDPFGKVSNYEIKSFKLGRKSIINNSHKPIKSAFKSKSNSINTDKNQDSLLSKSHEYRILESILKDGKNSKKDNNNEDVSRLSLNTNMNEQIIINRNLTQEEIDKLTEENTKRNGV